MDIYSDPAHALFGQEVPAGRVGDPNLALVRGAMGLIFAKTPDDDEEDEWSVMERVNRKDLSLWKEE